MSHQSWYDGTAHEAPHVPLRRAFREFLRKPHKKSPEGCLYILSVVLGFMIFVMSAHALTGINSNPVNETGYVDPTTRYESYASLKLLLFTSIYNMAAVFCIIVSQAVFSEHSPGFRWVNHFRVTSWPAKLFNTWAYHVSTFIFWIASFMAQTIWLSQKYWCSPPICIHLLYSSVVYDGFLAAFALIEVFLWIYPMAKAVQNFFRQLSKRGDDV